MKEWLQLIKDGKGASGQPAVDETHLNLDNPYDGDRKVLPWTPTVGEDKKVTLRVGLTYAGGKDALPIMLTTQIGMNLTLEKSERLTAVHRYIETPEWLGINDPSFKGRNEDQRKNQVDDTFSSKTVFNLSSMFYVNETAALTHKRNLDPLPLNRAREDLLGQMRKNVTVPMANNTFENFSDDHPIFRLNR